MTTDTATLERPGKYLSTPEMVRESGATYRMIDHWCRLGLLVPDVDAHGSGSQRRFSRSMVPAVRVVGLLMRLGVPHEEIRRIARDVADRHRLGEPLGIVTPYTGVTLDLDVIAEAAPPARRPAPVSGRPGPR